MEQRGERTLHSEAHRKLLLMRGERKNTFTLCVCASFLHRVLILGGSGGVGTFAIQVWINVNICVVIRTLSLWRKVIMCLYIRFHP